MLSIAALLILVLPHGDPDAETKPRYAITDLGAAAGKPRRGSPIASANSINAKGQVVGWISFGDRERAFLWEDGRTTYLTPADDTYSALRINDRGQILIHHNVPMLEDQPPRPEGPLKARSFLRDGGKMIDLGMMHAQDLNNRGQVVGTTEIDGESRLVLWEAGRLTDLSRRGVTGRFASFHRYALNDRGQVIGTCDWLRQEKPRNSTWRGFLWDQGRVIYLGDNVRPEAINERGQIVAHRRGDDLGPLVLMDDQASRHLAPLRPRPSVTLVMAIDDKGQAVGTDVRLGEGSRAVRWIAGTPIELTTLIPADSGWTLEWAHDINERGQIVGSGRLNGRSHAYLLTPSSK